MLLLKMEYWMIHQLLLQEASKEVLLGLQENEAELEKPCSKNGFSATTRSAASGGNFLLGCQQALCHQDRGFVNSIRGTARKLLALRWKSRGLYLGTALEITITMGPCFRAHQMVLALFLQQQALHLTDIILLVQLRLSRKTSAHQLEVMMIPLLEF
jgi:hypothetical protein